jgi:hypothetical protein
MIQTMLEGTTIVAALLTITQGLRRQNAANSALASAA